MVDINKELFRKFKVDVKLEIVNNLSNKELLNLSLNSITKIVKEVGRNFSTKPSHDKILRLNPISGNRWNSDIYAIYYIKKKLSLGITIYLDNTDPNTDEWLTEFLKPGKYNGSYTYNDAYNHPHTTYYTYDEEDKARFMKAVCLTYLKVKYGE